MYSIDAWIRSVPQFVSQSLLVQIDSFDVVNDSDSELCNLAKLLRMCPMCGTTTHEEHHRGVFGKRTQVWKDYLSKQFLQTHSTAAQRLVRVHPANAESLIHPNPRTACPHDSESSRQTVEAGLFTLPKSADFYICLPNLLFIRHPISITHPSARRYHLYSVKLMSDMQNFKGSINVELCDDNWVYRVTSHYRHTELWKPVRLVLLAFVRVRDVVRTWFESCSNRWRSTISDSVGRLWEGMGW